MILFCELFCSVVTCAAPKGVHPNSIGSIITILINIVHMVKLNFLIIEVSDTLPYLTKIYFILFVYGIDVLNNYIFSIPV